MNNGNFSNEKRLPQKPFSKSTPKCRQSGTY